MPRCHRALGEAIGLLLANVRNQRRGVVSGSISHEASTFFAASKEDGLPGFYISIPVRHDRACLPSTYPIQAHTVSYIPTQQSKTVRLSFTTIMDSLPTLTECHTLAEIRFVELVPTLIGLA